MNIFEFESEVDTIVVGDIARQWPKKTMLSKSFCKVVFVQYFIVINQSINSSD